MSTNAADSMTSTAADLLVEAGLLRSAGRNAVIFVEGDSDRRFFENMFRQSVMILPAHSYANVEKIINLYNSSDHAKFPRILGIVDRDYRIAAGEVQADPNLICTELRDIECEMIESDAFLNMMDEYCSQKFRSTWPQREDFRDSILKTTADVGRLRLYNHVKKTDISFKKLDFSKVHDFKKHELDKNKLISHLRGSQTSGAKIAFDYKEVETFSDEKKYRPHTSPLRLTRGHDVFALVYLYLQKGFGRANIDVKPDSLESAIRIGFKPLMRSSPTVKRVIQWFNQAGLQDSLQ